MHQLELTLLQHVLINYGNFLVILINMLTSFLTIASGHREIKEERKSGNISREIRIGPKRS